MTDEQFTEFLRDASRDYNPPPDVPRDAIWARIQEARQDSAVPKRIVPIVPNWMTWGMGIAAALLVGVAIGLRVNIGLERGAGSPGSAAIAEEDLTDALPDGVMRLVTLEHLSRTAGFLTMFRTDARMGRAEADLAVAARDMLATTRLLQGSPAARDLRLKELLDDLELILVQIAELRGNGDAEERDLITHGIEQRDIMLKLRAATSDQVVLPGIQGVL